MYHLCTTSQSPGHSWSGRLNTAGTGDLHKNRHLHESAHTRGNLELRGNKQEMERERSNVGTFFFKYEEIPEGSNKPEKVEGAKESVSQPSSSEMRQQLLEKTNSLARLHKTKLNYSQEDIHALATKAELLVLTGSNHDLRVSSSDGAGPEEEDEDRRTRKRSECFPDDAETPDLDIIDTNYEEPCLSGTWEHDIQEQYLSEGSALGTWDNSMKSVLCFGEDYSNYIRRKSELPSIDLISSNSEGLQVTFA